MKSKGFLDFSKLSLFSAMFISMAFSTKFQQNEIWKAPKEADLMKNPFVDNAAATEKGRKLFLTICNVCHGDKGKGDGVGAIVLNPKPANFTVPRIQNQSDGSIFWKLTTGKDAMASYQNSFTIEQRWQLVNYVRELGKDNKTNK